MRRFEWWILAVFFVAGCQSPPPPSTMQVRDFRLQDVAKGDIDMVAEITVRQHRQYLRQLAKKLYRRNPDQLRRGLGERAAAVRALLDSPPRRLSVQWQNRRGGDLITLALSPQFRGDRVAAFVYGLRTMAIAAYGGEGDFYLPHGYDPQKIYYLARNIEIAAWRLRASRTVQGRPVLLSGGVGPDGTFNASFERLFGKLVALHDHFAQVVAEAGNRRIKNVIQSAASAVFFPI